jgi:F0F1-type ATP synthase assembly protein I
MMTKRKYLMISVVLFIVFSVTINLFLHTNHWLLGGICGGISGVMVVASAVCFARGLD